MWTIAESRVGWWAGRIILEYCPREKAGCERRRCWPAALCRTARAKQAIGVWQALAQERRRDDYVWVVLAVASLVLVVVSFAWATWL